MFFKNIFSCKPYSNYEDNLALLEKKLELDCNQTKAQNEKQKQKNLKLQEELYRTQLELNKLEIKEKNKSILDKIKEYFWTHIVSSLIIIAVIFGGAILFFYYFNYTPNYFPNIIDLGTSLSWIAILVALFTFIFNFSFYLVHLMENELSGVKNKQLSLFLIIPILISIVSVIVDYKFNVSSYFSPRSQAPAWECIPKFGDSQASMHSTARADGTRQEFHFYLKPLLRLLSVA